MAIEVSNNLIELKVLLPFTRLDQYAISIIQEPLTAVVVMMMFAWGQSLSTV
jgi:hypothetical protein